MSTVYKYPLAIIDRQVIPMLRGAEVLHVEFQHNLPCLWARVDEKLAADDTEMRSFVIAGTGHTLPEDDTLYYVGTVLELGGDLVWHVFEAELDRRRNAA